MPTTTYTEQAFAPDSPCLPTTEQREAIREKLESAGMPDVLAFMAAERATAVANSLACLFIWEKTPEGHEFWSAVDAEMCALNWWYTGVQGRNQ